MTSWLFNFSVSDKTGAMRRIMATIRFYDDNGGAIFILNSSLRQDVRQYSHKNRYFFVNQTFLERVLKNEDYIREVIIECGRPDIYFSYGIPIYQKIGKFNWFHVSNALSLTVKHIRLSAETKIKMLLLKHRIQATVDNMDIVSGESQYTLDVFQREIRTRKPIRYQILRNGYNSEDMSMINPKKQVYQGSKYAMTIGIASYKRLDVVHTIFKQLQAANRDLKTLYVVAGPRDLPYISKLIPEAIKLDGNVVVDTFERREDLVIMMNGMDYYISASQIENSSNALLEGLIFSKNVIATDIPSHRELLVGEKHSYLTELISGEQFIYCEKRYGKDVINSVSWETAVKEMFLVGESAT